jgi:hypothetical protein
VGVWGAQPPPLPRRPGDSGARRSPGGRAHRPARHEAETSSSRGT